MARRRDAVRALDGTPPVVSISDLHGYRADAERALLALRDHSDYDPVVTRGDDGALHWAGNDYVLVFNGDLVDRGPDSPGCVDLAGRLQDEAPPGRVRYHLGNHEGYLLFQRLAADTGWYCSSAPAATRRAFLARIATEDVTMAYEGYTFTYSHAGSETGVDVTRVNDRLATVGAELLALADGDDGPHRQRAVLEAYPDLFGVGQPHRKGPGASPLWLSFDCLPA
ncbi:metallophosphoesterase, partial [Halobacterium bonnevillei]